MNIKFSHRYPKLHDQKSARLVHIHLVSRSDMCADFIEYDTIFRNGNDIDHYPLPSGKYMVLVFLGDKLIPFTTARRHTEEKFRYYQDAIGRDFEIVSVVAAEEIGAVSNSARDATRGSN